MLIGRIVGNTHPPPKWRTLSSWMRIYDEECGACIPSPYFAEIQADLVRAMPVIALAPVTLNESSRIRVFRRDTSRPRTGDARHRPCREAASFVYQERTVYPYGRCPQLRPVPGILPVGRAMNMPPAQNYPSSRAKSRDLCFGNRRYLNATGNAGCRHPRPLAHPGTVPEFTTRHTESGCSLEVLADFVRAMPAAADGHRPGARTTNESYRFRISPARKPCPAPHHARCGMIPQMMMDVSHSITGGIR